MTDWDEYGFGDYHDNTYGGDDGDGDDFGGGGGRNKWGGGGDESGSDDGLGDDSPRKRRGVEDDDPFRGGGDPDDDVDFKPDFKQMQQTTKGDAVMQGKKVRKAARTIEEIVADQLRGVMSSYAGLSDSDRNEIISEAENIPGVGLLHLETLVLALLWKHQGKVLNKKNLADFSKHYKISDQISLVRYIRMVG